MREAALVTVLAVALLLELIARARGRTSTLGEITGILFTMSEAAVITILAVAILLEGIALLSRLRTRATIATRATTTTTTATTTRLLGSLLGNSLRIRVAMRIGALVTKLA